MIDKCLMQQVIRQTVCALFAMMLIGQASAGGKHGHKHGPVVYYDYATVLKARPIYKTKRYSSPRQECWQETTTRGERGEYRSDSATGTILGGIIGAAVGHELGHHKRNKQVGAVAGAVLGSSIGHDLSRKSVRPRHQTQEHCRTVYDEHNEEYVSGYRVTYRYQGENYKVRTRNHPGDSIKLRVSVSPVL